MVDILHMGLVDEIVIGREVERRIPQLIKVWLECLDKKTARLPK